MKAWDGNFEPRVWVLNRNYLKNPVLQQESKTAAVLRCIQNLTLSLDFDLLDFLYQFPMVNLFI